MSMRILLHSVPSIIFVFILAGPVSCWADEMLPSWHEVARKFVEDTAQLIKEANTSNSNVLELLQTQEAAVKKLKSLPSPSVEELTRLIQSSRLEEREAALATAMILEFHESTLIKATLLNYEQEQGLLAKIYSQRVLGNIAQSQLKSVETQLFGILQNETEESIIIAGMPNVMRLDRQKRTAVFVQHMKNGSDGILRACTVALAKLGRPDLNAVKTRLKQLRAKKAVSFLDRYGETTIREVMRQGDK